MSAETINRLAELTGISAPTIRHRLAALRPSDTGKPRRYESADALPLILGIRDGERLDPQAEKARLDRLRGDELEDRIAERRRELLPAGTFEQALASAFKVVAQALESLPDVLERDAGIDGAAVERCQSVIDRLRDDMANKLQSAAHPAS